MMMNDQELLVRGAARLLIALAVFLLLSLPCGYSLYKTATSDAGLLTIPKSFSRNPLVGGFNLSTSQSAQQAHADGIQVAFQYHLSPATGDPLHQTLQRLNMQVIDGSISSDLYYYECYRIQTVKPPPAGLKSPCPVGGYPIFRDQDALFAAITAHLQQVQRDQLIIGYWVLDDWVSWDAGSARQLLLEIHRLIAQYTPGRAAICGFGATLYANERAGWHDWIAENYAPGACDKLGFYIYTPELASTSFMLSPYAYDWSMTDLLPAMFTSLEQRGWRIDKEPLIGIVQAFGGPLAHKNSVSWTTPEAPDIEAQSRSFCEHGATGLVFYAWDDSEFGPDTRTPMNSPEIQAGMQKGIAACKHYWSIQT